MKKRTKRWLIAGAILVVLGTVIMTSAIFAPGNDIGVHNFSRTQTSEYLITEEFSRINISVGTTDIYFSPSEDGTCRVVAYDENSISHSASVKDDTLWVKSVDDRKWYQHIGIYNRTPELEIFLPKAEYDLLYINGDTGNVNLPYNFEFENIDISVSTGDIGCFASASGDITLTADTGTINTKNISAANLTISTTTGRVVADNVNAKGTFNLTVTTGDADLSDIRCTVFTSVGDTGEITMDELVAMELISIERTTGDIDFTRCDAPEAKLLTDTGDITGSFLTEKVFLVESDTGDTDTPRTTSGGVCEAISDTGDIRFTLSE